MPSSTISEPTVVAFVSGKGGVGKTMLAVAAAREFSLQGPTLILDLDFFNRGLSGLLGAGTTASAVQPPLFLKDSDGDRWYAREVDTNLFALSFPDVEGVQLAEIDSADVSLLATQLNQWILDLSEQLHCQTVVLDCHGGPDHLSFAAVKVAQKTLMISEPDQITLYGTLHFLRRLGELSLETEKVHLVFNKVVDSIRARFLFFTYNRYLRGHFGDKPLLALFPLEVYLTKHFEHHPFVTDDFPRSMLARKTQVMLADLMDGLEREVVPARARNIPRLVAKIWRTSFGRRPKIIDLDFVMKLSFFVLIVFFAGLYLPKIFRFLSPLEVAISDFAFPILVSVPIWATFVTLLSWSTKLEQQMTLLSCRENWGLFFLTSLMFTFIWLSPIAIVVAVLLGIRVFDPEFMVIRYVWYMILLVLLITWAGHIFFALRDLKYTKRRIEPAMRTGLGILILTCCALLVDGVPFRNSLENYFEIAAFDFVGLDESAPPNVRRLEIDDPFTDFHSKGGLEWHSFEVLTPGHYVIKVDSVEGDPTVALYGPNSVSFITEDDDGGGGWDSEIRRHLELGTYFLVVREFAGESFFYSIRISTYEPFKLLGSADVRNEQALSIGGGFGDVLSQGGLEWFTFLVEQQGRYIVSVRSDYGDPTLALYGPDSVVFVAEDDDGGMETDSLLGVGLSPGRYYLAVREYEDEVFAFSVSVSQVKEFRVDDKAGRVDSHGGLDWFEFSVEKDDEYIISVDSDEGDPVIALYGADGMSFLAESDDDGEGENPLIRTELAEGRYYLAVWEYEGKGLKYMVDISGKDSGRTDER